MTPQPPVELIRIMYKSLDLQAVHLAFVRYKTGMVRKPKITCSKQYLTEVNDLLRATNGSSRTAYKAGRYAEPFITLGALLHFCTMMHVHPIQIINGVVLYLSDGIQLELTDLVRRLGE